MTKIESIVFSLSFYYPLAVTFYISYVGHLKVKEPDIFWKKGEKSKLTIACEIGTLTLAIILSILGLYMIASTFIDCWIFGAIVLYTYYCYDFCTLKITRKRKLKFLAAFVGSPIVIIIVTLLCWN